MCTYSMIQLKTISKLPLNKHCGMFESSSKFAELSKGKWIMTFRTILWKKSQSANWEVEAWNHIVVLCSRVGRRRRYVEHLACAPAFAEVVDEKFHEAWARLCLALKLLNYAEYVVEVGMLYFCENFSVFRQYSIYFVAHIDCLFSCHSHIVLIWYKLSLYQCQLYALLIKKIWNI